MFGELQLSVTFSELNHACNSVSKEAHIFVFLWDTILPVTKLPSLYLSVI